MAKVPRLPHLVGPIFGYELVRLARRAAHTRLRAGLAIVLLVTLFVLYSNWFPQANPLQILGGFHAIMERSDMARFAESFMRSFLWVQLAAAVILTPIFAAGSVTEEIQRRSLDHLLATELSSREIVLGKFLARSLHVAGILLTGLPILALTQFWGGVDMELILLSYAVILCTMASLAGLSLWFAVESGDLRATLIRVYVIFGVVSVVSFCLLCLGDALQFVSPLHMLNIVFNAPDREVVPWMVAAFAGVHIFVAICCAVAAANRLRGAPVVVRRLPGGTVVHALPDTDWAERWREALRPQPVSDVDDSPPKWAIPTLPGQSVPPVPEPEPSTESSSLPEPSPSWNAGPFWTIPLRHPPVDEDEPFLWKEAHFRGPSLWASNPGIMTCAVSALLIFAGMIVMFLLVATIEMAGRRGGLADLYNPLVRWFGLILLGFWTVSTGLVAAGSVSRERERQTLDSLFMLPVDRREILRAKWRAAWARGWPWGAGLFVVLGLTVLAGGLSPLALPMTVALAVSFAIFATSLGIWLSARCRTSFRAQTYLIIILATLITAPALLSEFAEAFVRASGKVNRAYDAAAFTDSLGPMGAWRTMTFAEVVSENRRRGELSWAGFFGAVACGVGAILGAGLCWLGACRRFENEGRT